MPVSPSDQARAEEGAPDFLDTLGMELVDWHKDHAAVRLLLTPKHLNRTGFAHGGVLLAMLDVACARAGCWTPEGTPAKFVTTLSLTTNFIRAAREGALTASARRMPGGKTIFSASGEVRDESGELLAIGQAVFRYRTTSALDRKIVPPELVASGQAIADEKGGGQDADSR